jgi:uncharacterized glyoxalase superfamily protein PhnB
LSFHFVTLDPARASQWYQAALDACEISRITLPNGDALAIDLQVGDSQIAISDEMPELGIVSPLTDVRDVPHDEVVRLAAEAFGTGGAR